jgi:hypothetical protein
MLFQQIWSHTLHQQPGLGSTFFSPPHILTAERTSRLVRLDPETGSLLWEAKIRNAWGWLTATDTLAFYLNQFTLLQCFAANTGGLVWERSLTDWNYFGYLVAAEKYLLVGGWRGYTPLHCLDAQTGNPLWRYPEQRDFGLPIPGPWGIALPDVIHAELIFLDWANGRIARRLPLPAGARIGERNSSIQRHGNNLIVTTNKGEIHLLNPLTDDVWQHVGSHDGGIATITPVISGANSYSTTAPSSFVALTS